MRNFHLSDANEVFMRGSKAGMRATDELYDLLIEEDCKAGDHSNALTIAYEMEDAGRMATTFHFNCLLSVQVRSCILKLISHKQHVVLFVVGGSLRLVALFDSKGMITVLLMKRRLDSMLNICNPRYC